MKILECSSCGTFVKSTEDSVSVTCFECIAEGWEPPKAPAKKSNEGFPRGWKFKGEFVHISGTVYHKGVEQPSLKGTLEPTPIEVKVKVSKREKREQEQTFIDEYASLKKKFKSATTKAARKKIERRLTQLSKLIK